MTVPWPRPLARKSFDKSPDSRSSPWLITHSAADHSEGPRLGVRPESAITVRRSLLSRATTAQQGAGSQLFAWRTSHSATFGASVKALASRVTCNRVSRVTSLALSVFSRGFQRADGSVRAAPRTTRGAAGALEARGFTAR
jgi:hypothetical protein